MVGQIAYVDGTDLEFHLDGDCEGVRFFGDINDLKSKKGCLDQCGIVEVEITVKRWVTPQRMFD